MFILRRNGLKFCKLSFTAQIRLLKLLLLLFKEHIFFSFLFIKNLRYSILIQCNVNVFLKCVKSQIRIQNKANEIFNNNNQLVDLISTRCRV